MAWENGVDGNIVFWRKRQARRLQAYDFHCPGQNGMQDILREIANAVKEILRHQISLPPWLLVREASRLFGFARQDDVENSHEKG